MRLNRNAAIAYARRYWNRPCDDGLFWTSMAPVNIDGKRKELNAPATEGWEAIFVPYVVGHNANGPEYAEELIFRRLHGGRFQTLVIQEWAGLLDCAHFLSRCLQNGGIDINFASVPKIVQALLQRSDTKLLCEKITRSQGQRVVDTGVLKKGDIIAYFNISSHDTYHRNQYSHSAMYVGKDNDPSGGISCHTTSRFSGENFPIGSAIDHFADSWFLHDGLRYTLIHLSQDDDPLAENLTSTLKGWWKIECGGRTTYYLIYGNGQARASRMAPKSKTDIMPATTDSSYYFQQSQGVVFTWRSGNVDIWGLGAHNGREYDIKVNDLYGKATRIF